MELQTFTKFGDLLPELRTKIWEFAALTPRLVSLLPRSHNRPRLQFGGNNTLYSITRNPGVLGACFESRQVALKVLRPEYESDAANPYTPTFRPIYFNAAIDWLHIEAIHLISVCRAMTREEAHAVRFLAISRGKRCEMWCPDFLKHVAASVYDLANLEVVVVLDYSYIFSPEQDVDERYFEYLVAPLIKARVDEPPSILSLVNTPDWTSHYARLSSPPWRFKRRTDPHSAPRLTYVDGIRLINAIKKEENKPEPYKIFKPLDGNRHLLYKKQKSGGYRVSTTPASRSRIQSVGSRCLQEFELMTGIMEID